MSRSNGVHPILYLQYENGVRGIDLASMVGADEGVLPQMRSSWYPMENTNYIALSPEENKMLLYSDASVGEDGHFNFSIKWHHVAGPSILKPEVEDPPPEREEMRFIRRTKFSFVDSESVVLAKEGGALNR